MMMTMRMRKRRVEWKLIEAVCSFLQFQQKLNYFFTCRVAELKK